MIDPDVIARVAERKIQEAIEEGKLDNLPGKGKPLVFDDDPATPAHLRLANKVLKNAGVLPDWIQVQKDIVVEREEAAKQRARLVKENQSRRTRIANLPAPHPHVAQYAEWHARNRAAYLKRLKSVNTSILKFSMLAPSTAAPFFPYRIEAEMAEFDAVFAPVAELPPVEVVLEPASESQGHLRAVARGHYLENGGGLLRNLLAGGRGRGATVPEVGLRDDEDIRRSDIPDEMKQNSKRCS
jgi:DnaJ homolog subfamily C member 28